jgi:hypothetical protein
MRNTKLVAATFVIALAACMLSTDSAHAWRRYRTVWGPQPVMVAPQPVWVQQPQPVWVQPQPVVVNRPVWVQQPTVVRTYRAPRRAYRPVVIW